MKMKVFFVICGLLLLSSCSILPPKLWTDEEVLDRLYRYYEVEFEILTVEQEESENFFTDNLIKGKKYTMSPVDNSDIVIHVTSEVTHSNGLFPGFSYYFTDNYITLLFYHELTSWLEISNIAFEKEDNVTIYLDEKSIETVIERITGYINQLGESIPFNTERVWSMPPGCRVNFNFVQDGVNVNISEAPFHVNGPKGELPYLYMDADEVLSRLSEEIAAMEEERY